MLQVKLNDLDALDLVNGPPGFKLLDFDNVEELEYVLVKLWNLTIREENIYKIDPETSTKQKVGEIYEIVDEGADEGFDGL